MASAQPLIAVRFVCIAEGNRRLRVRVTSPGYQNGINCQFPRAIRQLGQVYWAPASAVTLVRRGIGGSYFYRVVGSQVRTGAPPTHAITAPHTAATSGAMGPAPALSAEVLQALRVFGDDEQFTDCVVCMDRIRSVVLVPCGHFSLCAECAHQMQVTSSKCPMCRSHFSAFVSRDQCQGWEEDTAVRVERSRSLSRSASGSSMTDEAGSSMTYEAGSSMTDEAGSSMTYEAAAADSLPVVIEEVMTDEDEPDTEDDAMSHSDDESLPQPSSPPPPPPQSRRGRAASTAPPRGGRATAQPRAADTSSSAAASKRRPGRPRVRPLPDEEAAAASKRRPGRPRVRPLPGETAAAPKRRPGRPRVRPLPAAKAPAASPAKRRPGRPRVRPLPAAAESPAAAEASKRRPGRPRVRPEPETSVSPAEEEQDAPKRPRGRPPKRPRGGRLAAVDTLND
mmetsp:Transcript_45214/g.113830  ORF Transcript_45214/g.113830 Transcript_45214/m.113830 type:complete len:451 (-) Transcript_45214:105-1457(-)|eukprot:CAMPEP_0177651608 /NCGR_PEP_ID=MMETSP0447-20121125/12652_1 /TAXON_ID=0 /ORGANISM="Stygamoeba regulata, Strain BSH-02190019" /LENGTH=450 /DNA_ID=CAMNT_0019154727 /DNA_START=122 /DNA_END=1474 /DNA_ORIENTATION=+